jgi:hypothetical protein
VPESSQSAQPAATRSSGGGSWFQHKYGPLPLWLWLGLILGGLLLLTEYRSKKAASASAATTPTTSSTVPNNSSGVVVVDVDSMPYPVPTGTTTPAPVPTPIQGGNPPKGGPPVSKPPISVKPPVSVRPPSGGNTPPPQRTQKVGSWPNWDGSLWGIAQHYYGNGADWPKIYSANKSVIGSNPNMIKPGMVLVIP